MRLPDWMRVTRTQRTGPRTVTVTITADTSDLENALWRAHESSAELRYRRRIAHERSLGQAFVGVQLDRLCRDLGLDPVQVWRIPSANEERDRRFRAALAVQQRAALAVRTIPPWDGSVA